VSRIIVRIQAREAPHPSAVIRARAGEAIVSTDQQETPTSVTLLSVGYRARCTEAGCANLGRLILRYADAGGRPISNLEFCHAHARERLAYVRAAGLKVYDDRTTS
jgi:hypothetical protein